jgi:hypothetical protein
MSNYSTPTFTPFISGCGLCKPSTDYYNVSQYGGDSNYSNDGLIPESTGKNLYIKPNLDVPNNIVMKNNYGIEYATAFGGKLSKKTKSVKKSKPVKKVKVLKKVKTVKKLKGGFLDTIESEDTDIPDNVPENTSLFHHKTTTLLMNGGKNKKVVKKSKVVKKKTKVIKKSIDKKKMKGGMNDIVQEEVSGLDNNNYYRIDKMKGGYIDNVMSEENMQNIGRDDKSYSSLEYTNSKSSSLIGGKKKIFKGGLSDVVQEEVSGLDNNNYYRIDKMKGGQESSCSTVNQNRMMKTGGSNKIKKGKSKKTNKTKKVVSKKMKGGQESSGAIPMDQRFYNPTLPINNYPENSGNGIMSAYGAIDAKDVGVGMLAPYNASTCSTVNQNTMMKTGGSKNKNNKTKEVNSKKSNKTKEVNAKKSNKTKEGGSKKSNNNNKNNNDNNNNNNNDNNNNNNKNKTKQGNSNKNNKKMKGGQESSGATPMDQRFYNPTLPLNNYPENSGNGIMSAYGAIDAKDVGVGMLAPYNASTCSTVNQNTMMKTGGSKNKKYNKKGGKYSHIPSIPTKPIDIVHNGINGAVTKFSDFMKKLDEDYLKSTEYIKNVKIGNQRLIHGGKKSKKGGSNGSDFALTVGSRGPAGTPDNVWGVPGETWFRQFNKTGEYIPNSQLPYAATPELAGKNPSGIVSAYNEDIINNGNSNYI